MCHISMLDKRTEKCFDMYAKKRKDQQRGQCEHRHNPVILSRLLCDIPALVEVTESLCVCGHRVKAYVCFGARDFNVVVLCWAMTIKGV